MKWLLVIFVPVSDRWENSQQQVPVTCQEPQRGPELETRTILRGEKNITGVKTYLALNPSSRFPIYNSKSYFSHL